MTSTLCASCGQSRASREARRELPEACFDHEACALCSGWCWYATDASCAEAHGGWAAQLVRERERRIRAEAALASRSEAP